MRSMRRLTRRGTVTALLAAGAVMAVVAALAFVVFIRTASGKPTGTHVDTAQLQQSCGAAAGAWVQAYADPTLTADEWASTLTERTAPEAMQALSGVERSTVPTGGVQRVEVAADATSCDARVHTADGTVTALTLTSSTGAWMVTSWGSPSQEEG